MREEQTLARKVTVITNELRTLVTEANGKAQESLKSATYQYEKLLAKVRALDGTKVAEEAVKEFSHAMEEARRLIKEVIARDGEGQRVSSARTSTGVVAPRAAAPNAMPGPRGGAPGAAPAPSRVTARPSEFGRPAAEPRPAAPPDDKAREEARRLEQAQQIVRTRAAQLQAPAPAPGRGVVPGAPAQEAEEVQKLRGEIKELRNEIKQLREVLEKLVTERAKGNGGADPANTPADSGRTRRSR
jgi:hypothetical protein